MIDRRVFVVFVVLFAVSSASVYGVMCTPPCTDAEEFCLDHPSSQDPSMSIQEYVDLCISECEAEADLGLGETECDPICTDNSITGEECMPYCESVATGDTGPCNQYCAMGSTARADYLACIISGEDTLGLCTSLPSRYCETACETGCANIANGNYDTCADDCSDPGRAECENACVAPATFLFGDCLDDCYVCSDLSGAGADGTGENLFANIFVCPSRPSLYAPDLEDCKSDDSFYSGDYLLDSESDYIHLARYENNEGIYSLFTSHGALGDFTGGDELELYNFNASLVCYPGVEGQYWLWMQFGNTGYGWDENPSDGACRGKAHIVSWDKNSSIFCGDNCPSSYCSSGCVGSQVDWKDWAGGILDCCGNDYDETNPDDYDCAYVHDVSAPQYICGETPNQGWEWIDLAATADQGQMYDFLCGNFSVISNQTGYFYCGEYPAQNDDVNEQLFTKFGPGTGIAEVAVGVGNHRHGFGCFIDSNGHATIVECEGTETFHDRDYSAYYDATSDTIINGDYLGNPPVFCVRDSVESSNTVDYTRMTFDLDDSPGNDISCFNAGFVWTGRWCCGEPEPSLSGAEFYNDTGGIGGCWDSNYIAPGEYADFAATDAIVNNDGNFEGCLIQSGDPLLSMKNNQTGNDLITNLNYDFPVYDDSCHMAVGANSKYCSFEGQWRDSDGFTFYQKNMSWDADTGEIPWECCHTDECWDGTSCIADQTYDYEKDPVYGDEGYRCIDGEWLLLPLKYSWDNEKEGYCPSEEKCLIDPLEGCLDGETYYNQSHILEDWVYYCEAGNWTSRTKLIAMALLDYAVGETGDGKSPSDFTIFCDSYNNILNYYNYEIGKNSNIFTGEYVQNDSCIGRPCVNDFCVLQYPGKVAFGTSLNVEIENRDKSFLKALGEPPELCGDPPGFADDLYHRCDTSKNIWYNHNHGAVVYLPETPGADSSSFAVSWADIFENFRADFFETLRMGVNTQSTPVKNFSFFDRTNIFTKLYADVKGGKQVFAFLEEGKTVKVGASRLSNVDYLGVEYKGIAVSPCDLIRQYEKSVSGLTTVRTCDGTTTVFPDFRNGTDASLVDAWPDLTAKLRLR